MKRFMYLLLIGALFAGFTAAGTGRAEAMDNRSAALLAGTVAIVGGAVMYAAALDSGHQRTVYVRSYPRPTHYREVYRPVRTEVIYVEPGRPDCFRGHYRSNYGERHHYDRGRWHSHRR